MKLHQSGTSAKMFVINNSGTNTIRTVHNNEQITAAIYDMVATLYHKDPMNVWRDFFQQTKIFQVGNGNRVIINTRDNKEFYNTTVMAFTKWLLHISVNDSADDVVSPFKDAIVLAPVEKILFQRLRECKADFQIEAMQVIGYVTPDLLQAIHEVADGKALFCESGDMYSNGKKFIFAFDEGVNDLIRVVLGGTTDAEFIPYVPSPRTSDITKSGVNQLFEYFE